MMLYPRLALIGALAATALTAQSQKDLIVALQRDLASLREESRQAKAAQDEKLAAVYESLKNTFDLVARINEKMAATQATAAEELHKIVGEAAAPTRNLTSRVDAMNEQFVNLGNAVAELNARLGRIDSRVEDVKRFMQTVPLNQTPVPNGDKLFDDANRDYLGGHLDLALAGCHAYLLQFRDGAHAADAQFLVCEIYARQGEFNKAIEAYDLAGGTGNRGSDAHFMKAVALLKLERRSEAADEFRRVADEYPGSEQAAKATEYLRNLSPEPGKKKTAQKR